MAAMRIHDKKKTLKLEMEYQSLKVYKVFINDDPWLTLVNLMTMSNL